MRNSKTVGGPAHDERGVALIAALLLVAIVGVVGATVLMMTSTELKMSTHYKSEVQAFYVAEAAIAEAKTRLRGTPGTNPIFIGDPTVGGNARWSAYFLTSMDWKPADDRSYIASLTNFIPLPTAPTNTLPAVNSVQTTLPYWAKIRHKTEYDAERAGYRPNAPHYVDGDGSPKTHRAANPGNVIYFGYPSVDSKAPVQFTTAIPTALQPVELITASGGRANSATMIEVEVIRHPGPMLVASLYAKKGAMFLGPASVISGNGNCGVAKGIPPVYGKNAASPVGSPTYLGNPPSPQQGSIDIDISRMVDDLKAAAILVTSDQGGANFGNPAHYVTIYANTMNLPNTGGLTIRNGIGYGMLLVQGDLTLEGAVEWNGMILSTGTLRFNGVGRGIRIRGAVWADRIIDGTGALDVRYDSCQVKAALAAKPLTVKRWQERF